MATSTEPRVRDSVPEPFAATLHDHSAGWALELSGECDLLSLEQLRSTLADAESVARGGGRLLVDVSRLTFCDARSAGLILETTRAVRSPPVGARGIVKRVLDLTERDDDGARGDRRLTQPPLSP